MNAIEAFVGSLGILLGGFVTIPLVGKMCGATISFRQGAAMSLTFFVLRFIWLWINRSIFDALS